MAAIKKRANIPQAQHFEEIHKLLAVASDMTDKRPCVLLGSGHLEGPKQCGNGQVTACDVTNINQPLIAKCVAGLAVKSVINNMSCNQLPRKTLDDIFLVCEVVRALACYQGRNRLFGDAGFASERGLRIEFVHSLPYRPHA